MPDAEIAEALHSMLIAKLDALEAMRQNAQGYLNVARIKSKRRELRDPAKAVEFVRGLLPKPPADDE